MNKLKVAKSILILGILAQSCSFAKKLLKFKKVAKKLPKSCQAVDAYLPNNSLEEEQEPDSQHLLDCEMETR
jgi:hypothetical protein